MIKYLAHIKALAIMMAALEFISHINLNVDLGFMWEPIFITPLD